ncbi:MAG: pyridoxal phosphate-dependent aminotransferase [Bacteroidia bacterium]
MLVSDLAENIIGSEIIKLAGEVNKKIQEGQKIYNLTIGDFSPKEFPIPTELTDYIKQAYSEGHTNYPPANGIQDLRDAVSNLLDKRCQLSYSSDDILISGGARPLIYAVYRTLVNPGEKVIYAVPSWNNNHYSYLEGAVPVEILATPENNFMPSPADIEPHLKDAALLALCSPQNPTGTTFTKEALSQICEMVVKENHSRSSERKPLYVMYDQIYWELTYNNIEHVNPVTLNPEMKKYTIFVDGISKSLAATGVRVGWSFGPNKVIAKMRAILSHIGAWAPKAEQVATAKFLQNEQAYVTFIEQQRQRVLTRLNGFYQGFVELKKEGFDVTAVAPQAAIYLTVQFNLIGKTTSLGKLLANTKDVTAYLLNEAKVAIVPFYAFGTSPESTWYRLSVGTCSEADVKEIINNLRNALSLLK